MAGVVVAVLLLLFFAFVLGLSVQSQSFLDACAVRCRPLVVSPAALIVRSQITTTAKGAGELRHAVCVYAARFQ